MEVALLNLMEIELDFGLLCALLRDNHVRTVNVGVDNDVLPLGCKLCNFTPIRRPNFNVKSFHAQQVQKYCLPFVSLPSGSHVIQLCYMVVRNGIFPLKNKRLRIFENRILRLIFGPRSDENRVC